MKLIFKEIQIKNASNNKLLVIKIFVSLFQNYNKFYL